MTGKAFLDFLMGTTGQIGILDKNVNDTEYRAFMLVCLNLVLKDISARQINWHWRFLEKTATMSTVADQLDYDLPTDIDTNKLFAVFDRTSNVKYEFIPHDLFIQLAPNPSIVTGNSRYYTVWANNLKLYPVPSSVYTVYAKYVKTITALTDSDSSTTDVPSKYDNVIIDGVLKWAYKFDPQLGTETTQVQLYENGILNMQRENMAVIDKIGQTESHRAKYSRYTIGFEPYPLAS